MNFHSARRLNEAMRWHRRLKLTQQMEIQASHLAKYERYSTLVADKSLYSNTLVSLPTPNFLVFYNGQESAPERSVLRLSDAFEIPVDDPELELKVTVLNINPGNNSKLLDCCPPLKEYMLYIEKVLTYARTLPIQEAVWRSVQECIREGILTKFLTKYRNEAIRMSIFECDIERELRIIRQDSFDEGVSLGEDRTAKLATCLLDDNRLDELKQLSQDTALRERLFVEYSIK